MPTYRVYLRAGATRFSWADARYSLPELIFATVHEALDLSETEIDEVDSVVLSAHDLVDGRSLTSMTTAPPAGAYLKEEIRLGDDGAAALVVAAAQIRAGQARTCIVAGWGRASEGDGESISRALFDPVYGQPLGLSELHVSALRASAALGAWPDYGVAREAAAARLAELADARSGGPLSRGPAPPVPAPLRPEEVAPSADVVSAVIITAAETDVAVSGVGMSSDPYWPGDRNLLELTALRAAARAALTESGRAIDTIDCFELDGPTLFDEALALEAVAAAQPGAGMRVLAEDARAQPSGGHALGACAPAMGLVRCNAALNALREGAAGALVSGGSTVAGQTQTAVVLERC
jgi:acetyl-CoA C-acetyltransferase